MFVVVVAVVVVAVLVVVVVVLMVDVVAVVVLLWGTGRCQAGSREPQIAVGTACRLQTVPVLS